jgi:hypothetical protein
MHAAAAKTAIAQTRTGSVGAAETGTAKATTRTRVCGE